MNILIQKYIEYALEHEKYTLNGDYRKGNNAHKKLLQTIEKIKIEHIDIKREFYELLNFDNDSIKIWTSVTLIGTFEEKCLKVLTEIANNNSTILSLMAETTIDVWKKGMLENIVNWEN